MSPPPLWKHQREAIAKIERDKRTLLDMWMGTGKSRVIVEHINRTKHDVRVLIFAPKSVVPVWPSQFERFGADDGTRVVALCGPTAKRTQMLGRILDGHPSRLVIVTNYEGINAAAFRMALYKTGWTHVVCDESHRIKSHNAKQAREVARLAKVKKVPYRICLSGTPDPHSPLDFFGQFRFLDPRILGESWTRFRAQYAVLGGPHKTWVQGYKDIDDLAARIAPWIYRAGKDVIDLPEITHTERYCELTPKERKAYLDMEEDFVVKLQGDLAGSTEKIERVIAAPNVLARLTRLRQITSGFIQDDVETKGKVLLRVA